MAKPTAQQCHALTTYFITRQADATGSAPTVNRNKCRWGFEAILMDFTPTAARELIDYYVEHYQTPSVEWFLFNYEKVVAAKQDRERTEESAKKRRKETEQRLKEWKSRWKK